MAQVVNAQVADARGLGDVPPRTFGLNYMT